MVLLSVVDVSERLLDVAVQKWVEIRVYISVMKHYPAVDLKSELFVINGKVEWSCGKNIRVVYL